MSGDSLLRGLIIRAWEELIREYIARCRNWGLLMRLFSRGELLARNDILDKAYGLWGYIWHEGDLVFRYSHKLLGLIEEHGLRLHIHVNYTLKPGNFRLARSLYDRLVESINELRRVHGFSAKWYPEIDLIIADDTPSLLYCMEFKYYHYQPRNWNILEDLKKKHLILTTLKKHRACKETAIAILDDNICRTNKHLCDKIKKTLKKASTNTLILQHHINYKDLHKTLTNHPTNPQVARP